MSHSFPSNFNTPVTVPLHKGKMMLLMVGALAFVALGSWLALKPQEFTSGWISNPMLVHLVGAAGVLFFGFCAIIAIIRLVQNTPGLTLDEQGFAHYGLGRKPTLVKWADISALELVEVGRQKLVMIVVHNPEQYISATTSSWSRRLMQTNYKIYGAPLGLSAAALQCDVNELFDLLYDRLKQYHDLRNNQG